MDWPAAAGLITAIVGLVVAHAINVFAAETAQTEAIGFVTFDDDQR